MDKLIKNRIFLVGIIALVLLFAGLSLSVTNPAWINPAKALIASYTSPQPSEKALQTAAWIVSNVGEDQKSQLKQTYANSNASDEETVKGYALYLQKNPEKLALLEVQIENEKSARSKPKDYSIDDFIAYPDDSSENNQPIYADDGNDDLRNRIDDLEREQSNRDFWDSMCANNGQSYNSFLGAGCR
jgi:hypothetical protein